MIDVNIKQEPKKDGRWPTGPLQPTPQTISGFGYIAIVMAVFISGVRLQAMIAHDALSHAPVLDMGDVIFGFVGVITILLGKCLKHFEERIARLENSRPPSHS